MSAVSAPVPRAKRAAPRFHVPLWLRIVLSLLILVATVWFIVIPQFAEARGALTSLERVALPLLIAAVVLELSSIASYSALTALIVGRPRPSYLTLLRIDLTDLGVNHVVPGGGTTAGALRLRLFATAGIPVATSFTAATLQITGSNLILGAIFGIGIALSLATFAGSVLYLTAASAVLALLLLSAAAVWMLVRRTSVAVRVARALVRHLPFLTEVRAEAFVRAMAAQVRTLGTDPRRLAASVVFGGASWLLDAAALWVVFTAFGHPLAIGPLLTVYALGSILAALPLTPGGLGLVEGVMVPAFVAFGTPVSVALLGVLGWRILEYWMPIPISAIAYASLRFSGRRRSGSRRESKSASVS